MTHQSNQLQRPSNPPEAPPSAYEFADFRLDLRRRRLERARELVALTPKCLDILCVLVEKPGQVVEKDELMSRVWPDSFVEEANLTQNIFLLRKALEEGANGDQYIETVPRRGYRFVAPIRVVEQSDSGAQSGTDLAKPASRESALHRVAVPLARRTWVWLGTVFIVLAMAVPAWLFRGTAKRPAAAPEVVPLTSYAGLERSPSFSPDGNQVAFSWNGERQDNFDIYVKLIGSAEPVRLTTDPANDVCAAFSPDGRSIGFVRRSKERATFMVIPAIGGPERVVADVTFPYFSFFSWFPDGKWIVTGGLALISTETGETRSLTSPPTKSTPDRHPAVSPDGRTVAFGRWGGFMESIYLLDLTEDLKPKGEPRRLISLKSYLWGLAWTPDGREIIFSSGFIADMSLWKVPASGAGEPEPLPFTGEGIYPTVSRSGNRLAYQNAVCDTNIWRLSLSGPGVAAGAPSRFIASTRAEESAQYSPDGKRIAFESHRSGPQGLWVCDADGSNTVELFSRSGKACATPRWSPDGQRIAFNSNLEGNWDIYIIRASGGKPICLTTDSAFDIAPSWPRDGNWIYFTSNRTGRWEVWKVPTGGGKEIQVTRNGGQGAFESPDGQSIYYLKGHIFSEALWKMPVSGGEESQVLPSVVSDAFSLVKEGIYFIPGPPFTKSSIQFLSFVTGKVKTVAPMSAPAFSGLSVSPDGRTLLFSQLDNVVSDLMLVENFR